MAHIQACLRALRLHHHVKNGFIWLPIVFGHRLLDAQAALKTGYAFLCFCLIASSVYILNDIIDIAEDRLHPEKRRRPLASGEISLVNAWIMLCLLLAVSLGLSVFFLSFSFLYLILFYFFLNLAYSCCLKTFAIMDVVCIAIGFVVRIFAGGLAANVAISHWIVMMTFLLALFLALAKRRDDLLISETAGANIRKSLQGYNLDFLSHGITIMASVIIVAYILYTVSPEIVERHGNHPFYLSAAWVILGILRYLQGVFVFQKSGSPVRVLLTDHVLQLIIIGWLIHFLILLYP